MHRNIKSRTLPLLGLFTCFAAPCSGELAGLEETELSEIWGQSLITVTNTYSGGYEFSRILLNADFEISAKIGDVRAGLYTTELLGPLEGTGLAIDIGALNLGRSDLGEVRRYVTYTNPYLEFAYRNSESDPAREIIGMRLGFEGISGDFGVRMSTLSGALRIELGDDLVVDSLNDPNGGLSWNGLRCSSGVSCPVSLMDIGALRAGSAAGPSRDFFVSLLREPLVFPDVGGVSSLPALPGLWVNWRDRLAGELGAVPPNSPR